MSGEEEGTPAVTGGGISCSLGGEWLPGGVARVGVVLLPVDMGVVQL